MIRAAVLAAVFLVPYPAAAADNGVTRFIEAADKNDKAVMLSLLAPKQFGGMTREAVVTQLSSCYLEKVIKLHTPEQNLSLIWTCDLGRPALHMGLIGILEQMPDGVTLVWFEGQQVDGPMPPRKGSALSIKPS